MARPRKPTTLLELSGAFDKDPQRRRDNEPRDDRSIGDPPKRLSKQETQFWHELIEMCPSGVLKFSDRWAVEIAAKIMAHWEIACSADKALWRSLIAGLGLTPADRSKLSVKQEKPKNRFAALAEEATSLRKPN